MRRNSQNDRRKTGASATGPATMTEKPVYTAGQRKTMQQGLRILARIIARAHLRRQHQQRRASRPRWTQRTGTSQAILGSFSTPAPVEAASCTPTSIGISAFRPEPAINNLPRKLHFLATGP